MKYIEIKTCFGCKYSRKTDEEMDFCSLRASASKSISESALSNMSIIPAWCPLPDLPRWISVAERLPEPNEEFHYHNVLAALKNGWVGEVIFTNGRFYMRAPGKYDHYDSECEPTHWMPYPKGPEEE